MIEKDRNITKDIILKSVTSEKTGGKTISEISESLRIPFYIVCTLTDDLIGEGFVSAIEISPRKSEWNGDKILSPTQKGVFFFLEEGGFIKLHKEKKRKELKNTVAVIANIVNAVVLISVAIWATVISQRSAANTDEIKTRDAQIITLKASIDSLLHRLKTQSIQPNSVEKKK